jgi:hypothetical protein
VQKSLGVLAGSLFVGVAIVMGCSAPSADGSNLAGSKPGKASSSSGGSNDDDDGGSSSTTSSSSGGSASCAAHAKVSDRPACDTCTKAKCCDEIVACDKDSDCKAIQKCFEECPPNDDTCGLVCLTAHDKGANTLQGVSSCAQDKCATECPSSVPDAGEDPFGDF